MTYKPKLKLRDYQVEGEGKMGQRGAFALLMAMRTGKTLTVLTNFGKLHAAGMVDDLLVIAPAGVYKTWIGAMEESLDPALHKKLRVAIWESGPTMKQERALDKFLHDHGGPRVFLVNVEALSTVKAAREACELFLRQRTAMGIIDESTCIKNHKAKRTKYINSTLAPLCDYRRILSGLPTPRSPLDLFSQYEFLNPRILGYDNFWIFRAHYAVVQEKAFNGRRVKIVVAYRNEEELQRKIAPHSFRVPFRPDIPSTYSIRHVDMTKEQVKAYAEMKKYATTMLNETAHVTSTIVITQLLRLHQILCGHVKDEKGVLHTIPENRTSQLLELLDDYAGKAIIWASYDHDVNKIATALTKEYGEGSVARFWGGNARTREAEEAAFKTDPNCRWMVATPAAGGRGRTWDMADLVVYYSSTNNLEHRDQSEQRAQNVGKVKQVDYVDLIVPNTVEMKILMALRDKIDMASVITGDEWRSWIV